MISYDCAYITRADFNHQKIAPRGGEFGNDAAIADKGIGPALDGRGIYGKERTGERPAARDAGVTGRVDAVNVARREIEHDEATARVIGRVGMQEIAEGAWVVFDKEERVVSNKAMCSDTGIYGGNDC